MIDQLHTEAAESSRQRSPVQAVGRAVVLLRLLSTAGADGMSLKRLAAGAGLKTTTAHSLLTTLVEHDMAERAGESGIYRLGPLCAELHRTYLEQSDLSAVALPIAQELRDQTSETVFLSALRHDRRVDLLALLSPYVLSVNTRRTANRQHDTQLDTGLHATAAGKVLVAGLDPKSVEDMLGGLEFAAYTPHTKTAINEIRDEIAVVRQRGYAVNEEEDDVGVCGVAAPVRDATGVIAALCIGYPAARRTDEYADQMRAAVMTAAATLSGRLGAEASPTMPDASNSTEVAS